MELKDMNIEAMETRLAEIEEEMKTEGADIEKLTAEVDGILARKKELIAQAEERKAALNEVLADAKAVTIKTFEEETKAMNENTTEFRNTPEYINDFAEYIRTGEKRGAVLSENVSGGVAVPELVYDVVKTAWDKEGIMSLVKKSYLKGNLKVGFEMSATGAVIHTEGTDAPAQETLTLGIVTLVPESIKKWITISDEVLDLRGEEFLRYIYDELTYQIAKKAADTLIAKIEACSTVSTSTQCAVPAITENSIAMGTIASAIANLSDEANNPTIVMNKLTYAAFKSVQYANGYGADPFEGLNVEFNSTIKAYSVATTGETYAIVGDFGQGALANFPNGDEVKLTIDDKSLAEKDLVKIVGREYVAMDVVAPKAFVKIQK